MPTVRTYGGQKVARAPLPAARLSPDAPEAAFQPPKPIDTGAVVQAAQGEWEQEKQKADQVAVVGAASKLSAAETNLLYGQHGVMNREGKDAFGAQDELTQNWQKTVDEIGATLKTDGQKMAFQRQVAERWDQINRQVTSHVAQQSKEYDKDQTTGFLEGEQQNAILGYNDPERVAASVQRQVAAIKDFGARHGLPPEAIAASVSKALTITHAGVINQMLADDHDQLAEQYFKAHEDQINPEQAITIKKNLEEGTLRGESQRITDQIMAGTYVPKSAGQLESGNVDLTNRPRVKNADGSVSTVRSISIGEDGKEVLIPTVSEDGRVMTNAEAVAQYKATGKHLGKFSSESAATAYAQSLHNAQAGMIQGQRPTSDQIDAIVKTIQDPKLRDEVRRRTDDELIRQRNREREVEDDNFKQASGLIDQRKTLNPRDAIPPSVWNTLTPGQKSSLYSYARTVADPDGDNQQTNNNAWLDFMQMKDADVAKLTQSELNVRFLSKFGKAERGRAVTRWSEAINAPVNRGANAGLKPSFSLQDQIQNSLLLNNGIPADGSKLNEDQKKLVVDTEREVEALRVRYAADKGRDLTSDEERAIVDNVVLRKIFSAPTGWRGEVRQSPLGPGKLLIVNNDGVPRVPISKVPPNRQKEITQRLQGKVTTDKIERAYAAFAMGDMARFNAIMGEQ